jgi:broad specificity phosphatase PhoE
MTTWWWVRHGPTHQKVFTGWRDVPADLSDKARIARLHAALPQGALWLSSDLIRAVATADALAEGRERLAPAAALREFHFGDWDGLHFAEAAARDPDLSRRYWEAPGAVAPPGGESWDDAAARVAAFVASVEARHPGRDIVAVAHFGVILTRLAAALDLSPAQAIAQKIEPLSLTRIGPGGPPSVGPINHQP